MLKQESANLSRREARAPRGSRSKGRNVQRFGVKLSATAGLATRRSGQKRYAQRSPISRRWRIVWRRANLSCYGSSRRSRPSPTTSIARATLAWCSLIFSAKRLKSIGPPLEKSGNPLGGRLRWKRIPPGAEQPVDDHARDNRNERSLITGSAFQTRFGRLT